MENQTSSKLVPIGVLLLLLGFSSGFVAKAVPLTPVTALLIDGLRLCFFAGILLIIIGWLRNRRRSSTTSA